MARFPQGKDPGDLANSDPDALRAVVASLFDSSKTGFEIALGFGQRRLRAGGGCSRQQ